MRGNSVESVQRLVGRSVIELALHVDSVLIEAALLSGSPSQKGVRTKRLHSLGNWFDLNTVL